MQIFAQLFLGFSSGLPLLAIGSTLQAWLTEARLDLGTIGVFSLVGLPYTLKFLWAPFFDRYRLPFLGRRRGWLLSTQLLLILLFACFLWIDAGLQLELLTIVCALIAFVSASQDILVDALRRDSLEDRQQAVGSALFVNGYRLGMLVSGALALMLAEYISWNFVYPLIGLAFICGIAGTLLIKEPPAPARAPASIKQAVIEPFRDFFSRNDAVLMLLFILLYKFGDSIASGMFTPFYLICGYSKPEIAAIAKSFGLAATLGGALIGGILILKIGIARGLWIFGSIQALSTLAFIILISDQPSQFNLAVVIGFENLSSGMGTAAYTAFMATLCNRSFSATQYALLTSIMGIPRVIFGAYSGYLVEILGWPGFFIACCALALPGMLLLRRVAPWGQSS